ncbi:MAG TPA: SWIM zinc finger family protein [Isosphaeraceae bacterium]|nr:SWIM zinc finger family protein [Isosphaeraceae bacterium]
MSANITPAESKAIDPTEARRQRGLAIAAVTKITEVNGQWVVPSQTGKGAYRVNLKAGPFVPQCTCPDYAERGEPCKHVYAVRYTIERESQPDGSVTTTETLTLGRQTTASRANASNSQILVCKELATS